MPLAASNCGVRPPCAKALDDGESGKDQDQREPDIDQRQDRAIGDAFPDLGRLSEMIGHEHGLAVSWHQCVDRTKQHGGSPGSENGSGVAASDLAKTTRYAAIGPVLDGNETVHVRGPLSSTRPCLR